MFPLWVAKEAGIFARHKLDVDIQMITGGDVNLAALMRGEVDFIECAGGSLIPGIMAGADAVMIANLYRGNPYRLVVVPEVQQMSDLKGRRLAINKAGEFDNRLIELMLDRYGLVGNQDVTLVPLGGQTDRYTGLKGGLVDGTIVNPPVNLTAQNEGFHEIFNFNDLGISAVYISLFASRSTVQNRPRLVERFLAAMIEAEAYAKAEREFTIRLMGDYLKLGDRAALEGAYQAFAVESLAIPPTVPTDAVQAVMDETLRINPGAPVRDAAAVIDSRPLQAVEATGFPSAIQAAGATSRN
jgi:ABC-type nitrate/sulfonate/bicarbonate transport system substrate-binding protein